MKFLLPLLLIVLSRIIPHPPNFTAVTAVALFSTAFTGGINASLGVIFAGMFLTDLIFGLHSQIFSVYLCLGVTVLWGYFGRSLVRTPLLMLSASLLFYLITNFSEWLLNPIYPKNIEGLELCYLAAIPFFHNQVLGDLIYGTILGTAVQDGKAMQDFLVRRLLRSGPNIPKR